MKLSLLKYKHCKKKHDATLLLFWLWPHCKDYWNAYVPSVRAQRKMMQSHISYKIFIVNRYLPRIHRVHKKFHLNCIRNDSFETLWRFLGKWTNSNIRRAVTDGPFSVEMCQECKFNPKKEIPYWPYLPNLTCPRAYFQPKGKGLLHGFLPNVRVPLPNPKVRARFMGPYCSRDYS